MRSDTGPFVVVPVWVLDLDISLRALKLYMIHADWADRGGQHWHSRKTLAQRLGCTERTVDRCHLELVGAGALEIDPRKDPAGDRTSNVYLVARCLPQARGVETRMSPPPDTGVSTGGDTDVSLTRPSVVNKNLVVASSSDLHGAPCRRTKGGDGHPQPQAEAKAPRPAPFKMPTPPRREPLALRLWGAFPDLDYDACLGVVNELRGAGVGDTVIDEGIGYVLERDDIKSPRFLVTVVTDWYRQRTNG